MRSNENHLDLAGSYNAGTLLHEKRHSALPSGWWIIPLAIPGAAIWVALAMLLI
ncbi:hypothetical protein [Thalassovita sp.]|uniref:hypothetical protein n=1 Tax=Thalassovita sp. TaxID=1979401 RepID=UPI0029DE88C0|nr:hypothetical protein [Thalassovita sp.]